MKLLVSFGSFSFLVCKKVQTPLALAAAMMTTTLTTMYDHESSQRMEKYVLYYITSGCTGSTATYDFAKELIEAHGFKVYDAVKELDKPKKNHKYDLAVQRLIDQGEISSSAAVSSSLSKDWKFRDTIGIGGGGGIAQWKDPTFQKVLLESFRLMNEEAIFNNEVLFFFVSAKKYSLLQQLNTQNDNKEDTVVFGSMTRWNKLDWIICTIKDCFESTTSSSSSSSSSSQEEENHHRERGYPVYINNHTRIDNHMCFQRRYEDPPLPMKVHIDTKHLVQELQQKMKQDLNEIKETKELLYPSVKVYNEDLFAFEYTQNETIFNNSVQAWSILLQNILYGSYMNQSIIEVTLRNYQNTRSIPKLHSIEIDNFYDVQYTLQNSNPPLDYFIRN